MSATPLRSRHLLTAESFIALQPSLVKQFGRRRCIYFVIGFHSSTQPTSGFPNAGDKGAPH
jgi:hypothetical protein